MEPSGSPFRRPPARAAFAAPRRRFGPVPAAPLTASMRSDPAPGPLARGRLWAFAVGGAAYALDGLFVLAWHDWVAVAIHTAVLAMLARGLDASRGPS